MSMIIEVNSAELKAALEVAPAKVISGVKGWVDTVSLSTQRAAKLRLGKEVSEAATGYTLNHIQILSTPSGLTKTVKPTNKYAQFVITGRGPGKFPPWSKTSDPLNKWARKMGMNPFLVARKIAQKGTPGHPFMAEAYDDVKEMADYEADKVLTEIVGSI